MRRLRTVSAGRPGLGYLVVFAVLLALPVTLVQGAAASSTPKTVLNGLALPAETAITQSGDLYFTQQVSADTVTLSRLARGSSKPIEIYRLVGLRPYLWDIHFDPIGDLIFITSVATDPSSRRWALTQLDPRIGIASELAVTTGVENPTTGSYGSLEPLLSGTEIDSDGVDRAGTIYFSEHSIDPGTGAQVADLLALDRGRRWGARRPPQHAPASREVAHFAGSSGSDQIEYLAVAQTGDVYLIEDGDPWNLYQVSPAGRLRALVTGTANGAGFSRFNGTGLDAAGNLYFVAKSFNGWTGCNTSSTTELVSRIDARDLSDWTSAPTVEPVAQRTYNGDMVGWSGSSSFFRVDEAGDVYWVQSPWDCSSWTATANEVLGVARGQGQQAVLYEEPEPASFNSSAFIWGSLALATDDGAVYIASLSAGDLIEVRR